MSASEHLSPAQFMQRFKPTEGSSWDEVRNYYENEHPVTMNALREDIAEKGIRHPLEVVRGKVEAGHHRILAAHDVGVQSVPYEVRSTPSRTKLFWDPETRRDYTPDEDEHDEGQLRY